MNEAYTKLMQRQHTSKDAVFYEKMEMIGTKKRHTPIWKTAAAVVCICLLIPVTVWAAENIFGVTKVMQCERPMSDNRPGIGLDIQYENLQNYSLSDFSGQVQKLENRQIIGHNSWEEAETYLGIDLLDNPLLTAEDTKQMTPFEGSKKGEREHCLGIYRTADEQFYAGTVQAGYQRNGVEFVVSAMVTAQHPTVNNEDIANFHGTSITYLDYYGTEIETEQYTTQEGIPVLIVIVSRNQHNVYDSGADVLDCNAYFAVNNVSYTVMNNAFSFTSDDLENYANAKEKVMDVMLEVLDGFTLE